MYGSIFIQICTVASKRRIFSALECVLAVQRRSGSKSVFVQHFSTHSVWLSKIITWKLTNIDPCCQRQKC